MANHPLSAPVERLKAERRVWLRLAASYPKPDGLLGPHDC